MGYTKLAGGKIELRFEHCVDERLTCRLQNHNYWEITGKCLFALYWFTHKNSKAFDRAKETKRYAIFDAPILLSPKL